MSLQVEKLENNTAKLTIEVPAEEVEKAIESAYQKSKSKFSIPGFRKGKVPRKMIEKMYGVGVFYEDAVNSMIPGAYADAATESELEIVAQPEIDIVQIEAGKPFIFTAEVVLKPEVELGKYKGIEVEAKDTTVTDEEVDAELAKVQEQNSRLVAADDKEVENGDQVTIDFEGFVDGVAFEGGKGTNYDLVIGSHSFIDNFEEQLIGKNIGDEVDVNVTFPESYQAEELAGKPAVFKVKVNGIKVDELPELDDEFASEVSEYETVAEYKDSVKKGLAETKEKNAKDAKEKAAIDAVIADAKMDIPEAMIKTTQRQMMDEFAQRISGQGLSFEQYLQFTGMTEEQMLEQIRPQAELRIKSRLVLEAIVAAEKIEATEEDFEQEIAKMAEMYQMEADKAKELIGEAGKAEIMKDLAVTKAAEFVRDNAKESKSK